MLILRVMLLHVKTMSLQVSIVRKRFPADYISVAIIINIVMKLELQFRADYLQS